MSISFLLSVHFGTLSHSFLVNNIDIWTSGKLKASSENIGRSELMHEYNCQENITGIQ